MKLATTTYDFARYCDSYKEAIKLIHEAGFRYIDLSLDTIRDWDNGILIGDDWKKACKRLKTRWMNMVCSLLRRMLAADLTTISHQILPKKR